MRLRVPPRSLQKAVVYRQGDPADVVFFVESGAVKLTVINKQAKEAIIAILEAGDFVGEGCISNGAPRRSASASVTQDAMLSVIQKTNMLRAIHEETSFAEQFIAYILKRTHKIEADLVDQLFNSTEKRLARALLHLVHYGNQSSPETVISSISQEALSELVGSTRSRGGQNTLESNVEYRRTWRE